MSQNRKHNSSNPYQGIYKRVLCVCSAGLLRSPTIALALSQEPYNFNTRAVGFDVNYALLALDDVLIEWANEIVVANDDAYVAVLKYEPRVPVVNLEIPDEYEYRDPRLIELIEKNYD